MKLPLTAALIAGLAMGGLAFAQDKDKAAKKKSGATIQSESVNDACAYDPKVAATARPYR